MAIDLRPMASLLLALAWVPAAGCRGNRGTEPPIHLQQNMDQQKRFEAQEENAYFRDRRAMRPQVPHTVALGELRGGAHYYEGLQAKKPAMRLPVHMSKRLLARGQQRFDIYCSRCHGRSGNGKGVLTTRRIKIPPSSYMEPRLLQQPVGHFFRVISDGVRNMPAFRSQIPTSDRWAIAAYVRALQIAGAASCEQVPAPVRAKNGWCKQ